MVQHVTDWVAPFPCSHHSPPPPLKLHHPPLLLSHMCTRVGAIIIFITTISPIIAREAHAVGIMRVRLRTAFLKHPLLYYFSLVLFFLPQIKMKQILPRAITLVLAKQLDKIGLFIKIAMLVYQYIWIKWVFIRILMLVTQHNSTKCIP